MPCAWIAGKRDTLCAKNSNGFMVYGACRASIVEVRDTRDTIASDRPCISASPIQIWQFKKSSGPRPILWRKNSNKIVDSRENGKTGEGSITETMVGTGNGVEPSPVVPVEEIDVDIKDRYIFFRVVSKPLCRLEFFHR